MLHYNKLYQSLKKVSAEWHGGVLQWFFYWSYIKFFEDGTFIEAEINSDNIEKINSSFTKEKSNLSHGNFLFSKNEITLDINGNKISGNISSNGEVIFQKSDNWEIYLPVG